MALIDHRTARGIYAQTLRHGMARHYPHGQSRLCTGRQSGTCICALMRHTADFLSVWRQVVMHGLPYPETEHSEFPGYMPFLPAGRLPGFGDAWGDRQPQWACECIAQDVSGED
jgi:hypothetical protein